LSRSRCAVERPLERVCAFATASRTELEVSQRKHHRDIPLLGTVLVYLSSFVWVGRNNSATPPTKSHIRPICPVLTSPRGIVPTGRAMGGNARTIGNHADRAATFEYQIQLDCECQNNSQHNIRNARMKGKFPLPCMRLKSFSNN